MDGSRPAPVEVAAGLVFRDGKLLITQRPDKAHLGGLWEFPGGKREPNETFEECLVRELQEELGAEIQPLALIDSITHEYPGKTIYIRFYQCRWVAREPQAIGCQNLAWITRQELTVYEFPAADQAILGLVGDRADLWTQGD